MHIKFCRHGTGSAKAAAAYLLDARDHQGIARDSVEVLRGDPFTVAGVADSLDFKHKYTSGILAFAPEDSPTPTQLDAVLNEFEKTAFAGLDSERYSWSAILHRDTNGGCHIHVFAARVDLTTGKSLNIAPPGWEKTFDSLRDYFNHTHGWARPDDLSRARMMQPQHRAYLDAAHLRQGIKLEPNPKQLITDFLMQRLASGAITNRSGIIASLEDAGFDITRQGKTYLSVRPEPDAPSLRLKGTIYDSTYDHSNHDAEIAREDSGRQRANRGINPDRAERAYQDLEDQRRTRAEYNRRRYPTPCHVHQHDLAQHARAGPTTGRAIEPELDKGLATTSVSRGIDLSGHLRRELGRDAVVSLRSQGQSHDVNFFAERSRGGTQTISEDKTPNLGTRTEREGQQAIRFAPPGQGIGERGNGDGGLRCYFEKMRRLYDRIGETVKHRIESTIGAVQHAYETARRTNQQLVIAGDAIDRATGKTHRAVQRRGGTLERGIEGLRKTQREKKQKAHAKKRTRSRSGLSMGR